MASLNLPLHGMPFGDDQPNGNAPQQAATTSLTTTSDAEARDKAAEKLLNDKLAEIQAIMANWNLTTMSAILPSTIAPQAKKTVSLAGNTTDFDDLVSRTTITDEAQPVLETVLWSKTLLLQLKKLSQKTKGDAGRGWAHTELERVVFERHEGMSAVGGVSAVVREIVPSDVKEVMRRLKG